MSVTFTPMKKPSLCIVTPALADANNGNWQTARRWTRMLAGHYGVRLVARWPDGPTVDDGTDLLLALHARRSAASINAWVQAHPQRPLVVALTGTDLYRDIHQDALAQRSLQQATRLIVAAEPGAAGAARRPARQMPCGAAVQHAAPDPAQDRSASARHRGRPPARREVAADHLRGRAPDRSARGHHHHPHRPRPGPGAGRRRARHAGRPARTTAGWAACRTAPRAAASSARTC